VTLFTDSELTLKALTWMRPNAYEGIIKVKWTKDDIGNTGWRPGWYKAQVQSYCVDTDEIEVVYVSEPTCIYTLEVTPAISSGIVQVVKPYH